MFVCFCKTTHIYTLGHACQSCEFAIVSSILLKYIYILNMFSFVTLIIYNWCLFIPCHWITGLFLFKNLLWSYSDALTLLTAIKPQYSHHSFGHLDFIDTLKNNKNQSNPCVPPFTLATSKQGKTEILGNTCSLIV